MNWGQRIEVFVEYHQIDTRKARNMDFLLVLMYHIPVDSSRQFIVDTKRSLGQFFTVSKNPFELKGFQEWAEKANLPKQTILEPFAGANHIIKSLQDLQLCNEFISYDIHPAAEDVKECDTLKTFPTGFEVCVTNPPWLARNSATRRNLPYPTCEYDNMYKFCLELCLSYCKFVAALIPASFLQSELFRERLCTYILLHNQIFNETDNPVCLALFIDVESESTKVYYDDRFVGNLEDLEANLPRATKEQYIRFNDPDGQLGFISFDNTRERSIRFCEAAEIETYDIKHSSRFITRIGGDFGRRRNLLKDLNEAVQVFRDETDDLFLTPFKGIRDDGQYRRRMFYSLARDLINAV